MRKMDEIMKTYKIENLDIAVAILGIILVVIDAIKGVPFIKIWLRIIFFLVIFVFPLILIINFLRDPKEGEGFGGRGEKGTTGVCIGTASVLLADYLIEHGNIWNLIAAIVILVVCLEIINRYLWTKMSQISIDEGKKDKKDAAQFLISVYFALFFNGICLIVKWLCGIIF